jgi:hypothetical protein
VAAVIGVRGTPYGSCSRPYAGGAAVPGRPAFRRARRPAPPIFHALRVGRRTMRSCPEKFLCGGGGFPRAGSPCYRGREPLPPPPHPIRREHRLPACTGINKSLVLRVIPPPRRGAIHCAHKGFDESNPYMRLGGGPGGRVEEPLAPSPPPRENFHALRVSQRLMGGFHSGRPGSAMNQAPVFSLSRESQARRAAPNMPASSSSRAGAMDTPSGGKRVSRRYSSSRRAG